MSDRVRVRFAPSPTGLLHIGGLRTALFNYAFAKNKQGTFLLRLEDTDKARFVPESVENILTTLEAYGLICDEGPQFDEKGALAEKGEHGPYIQSHRLNLYKKHVDELIATGAAYYCFCSSERLERLREDQMRRKEAPRYDRLCRTLSKDDIAQKLEQAEQYVIRLAVPEEGSTSFIDSIREEVTIQNNTIDDQVLLKSDGYPTYHLANVIDDHLMEITHVFRAEEWLPSTPKHLILFNAFGWKPPQYGHLPMIMGPDRSKLSKRHGAEPASSYIKNGYLPEAVINYIALLGWNPGGDKEFFTLEEMIREFSIERVNNAPAIFDAEKLRWMNGVHMRKASIESLEESSRRFFPADWQGNEKMSQRKKVLAAIRDRMFTFDEINAWGSFAFAFDTEYVAEILLPKKMMLDAVLAVLNNLHNYLSTLDTKEFERVSIKEKVMTHVTTTSYSTAQALWPLRVALSGKKVSPDVFDIMEIIGKDEVLRRIGLAQTKLAA